MGLASGDSGAHAAAVLPDPTDPPVPSLSNADDLLSQLAGEEIDRLLAESETEATAPLPADRVAASGDAAPPEVNEPPPVDLKALAREVVEETSAKAVAPSVQSSATPATQPAPALDESSSESPVDSASAQALVSSETILPTAPAAPHAASRVSANEPTLASVLDEADAPLPIYLRPLEWLNAPLAWCSPAVREALGKVAIVTLVNAIAVLLYIVLFRRH